jgi:hypothetical protein
MVRTLPKDQHGPQPDTRWNLLFRELLPRQTHPNSCCFILPRLRTCSKLQLCRAPTDLQIFQPLSAVPALRPFSHPGNARSWTLPDMVTYSCPGSPRQHPSSWHSPLAWGSESGHYLTSLPRTEPSLTPRPGGRAPPMDSPDASLPPAMGSNSNRDSPGRGPPPQGDRQDRATQPPYHAPRRHTSPSSQEPDRAPRRKDHSKPLEAPVGGDGSRGTTLLPSTRGSMGFDSPLYHHLRHHPATPTRRDAVWAQVSIGYCGNKKTRKIERN